LASLRQAPIGSLRYLHCPAAELGPKISKYMEELYRPQSIVPDDVKRVLPTLRERGYKLAVISNRTCRSRRRSKHLPGTVFRPRYCRGEVNAWKPEPDIFLHACRRLGCDSRRIRFTLATIISPMLWVGLTPDCSQCFTTRAGIFPDAGCPTIKSFDELPGFYTP